LVNSKKSVNFAKKIIVMEKRKTEKADLENKKGLFLQIGLVVTLAVVLAAFEWKSYDAVQIESFRTVSVEEEEVVINTETPPPPPPPPPPPDVTTELEIVADDAIIENEIEINVEVDDRAHIEVWVAPVIEEEELGDEVFEFHVIEDKPGFPGGDAALLEWLGKNIGYPTIARESGIHGTVYLQFVVDRDGSITDIRIVRDIGGGCAEAAVQGVRRMPKWTPGKQRGNPVRVQYTLPVRFTLGG
jgi:protein TonB